MAETGEKDHLETMGLALAYASAALEWAREPAVYALFRDWLERNPYTEVLTREQLLAADLMVTALSVKMFGAVPGHG